MVGTILQKMGIEFKQDNQDVRVNSSQTQEIEVSIVLHKSASFCDMYCEYLGIRPAENYEGIFKFVQTSQDCFLIAHGL